MNQNNLFNLLGNRGKIWQGTQTEINKPVTSHYHRLEIENDGIPNSAIRVFDLPNGDRSNWDNEANILYEENIGNNHTADSPKQIK